MKAKNRIFGTFGILALSAVALSSCSSDAPFGSDAEGDVRMRLVINSEVTRAEVNDEQLRSNCVVYISNEKGLVYKYKGLENLPEQIKMKCGSYVAEAWTGDSVPASFDHKFYRGYQPFTVEPGVNSPVLKCGIANVVASVNASTIEPELMKDWTVTIGHGNATLDFTEENVRDAKGYYMLASTEKNLTYKVSGTTSTGTHFEKTGVITGRGADGAVERAHEYVLNFDYNPEYEQLGGGFFTITIDDRELLIEDEIDIYGCPTISGVEFNVDRQIIGMPGTFGDKVVKITGFGDMKQVTLNTAGANVGFSVSEINLTNHTATVDKELENAGLKFDRSYNHEMNLSICYLTLSAKFLNSLPERNTEYRFMLEAVDGYGKTKQTAIRVAVGDAAIVIEDPLILTPIDQQTDQLAVSARTATFYVSIEEDGVENPGVEYRQADGNGEWKFISISGAMAQSRRRAAAAHRAPGKQYKVTLSGLTPSVRYAYRVVAKDFVSDTYYFTTETVFEIPNAGMELWSNYSANSKVILPSGDGQRTFWDSGNHGSATMNVNLTQGSTDMFSGGSKSAKLRSQFVGIGTIGKFAAGNLFTGEYVGTDGTDGILSFGSAYNGSHPTKLAINVNYRPAQAQSKGANSDYIAEGAYDLGHIYIALSTEKVDIRTKASNRKLFNPKDECIVAYGEYTFTGNYGPDGALKRLEIPFDYYAKAKTTRPLYLIIVCSASKYGDYFSGGEGSVMYLDDFELVY